MRDLIRQIVQGYKSLKLASQDEGYVLFIGEEPDTKQPVAIKILPRALGNDPQIAKRFDGLAKTIRQLNHPNIASVRTVGEKAGLPYMVTRIIEGAQPLAAKLDQPWAVDQAAEVVMQVGQALEHAYNKGIVHGSLSPDNIAVQDNGKVQVNDFGLGSLLDLVGAPVRRALSPYLAPERAAGAPATASADVYSLGAILYSLLTKRPPQVVKGEVTPPSRYNPDVPAAMDQVVVRALALAPADRYADVKSFLAALGAVVLVPATQQAAAATGGVRCAKCGAENQTGRFCRKCGARLVQGSPAPARAPAQSKLDEPIQITRIEVGHIEVGSGVELHKTVIAQPSMVATGELQSQFPEPLKMPDVDDSALWPTADDQWVITMPEPPAMPVIDWAEIAPPMPQVPTMDDVRASEENG
jgi:hypothetical protein